MNCSDGGGGHNDTLGPLGIDYLYLHECALQDVQWLSFLLLFGWLCFLFYVLGSTADGYFSPTLANISDRLKIPYDVAGVTFLAFGNGAPDVFSSIAAYSSGVGETGISELLGGAMFVTTVVVGAVAIASHVAVDFWAFSRDLVALVCALGLLVALSSHHATHTPWIWSFLGAYGLYVVIVIVGMCFLRWRRHRRLSDASTSHVASPRGVLSAFWHALSPAIDTEPQAPHKYAFVTRDVTQEAHASVELGSPRKVATAFPSDVFDDHFVLVETLASPLISDQERAAIDDETAFKSAFSSGGGILESAYWSHLRWRWSMKRRIAQNFRESGHVVAKLMAIPDAGLVLARNLTIPLLDLDSWSRLNACLSLVAAPLFVLWVAGLASDVVGPDRIPLWQLVLVLGLVAGFLASFTTHRSRPPTSTVQTSLFLLVAFASCVAWIYVVANELMALLVAVGAIIHASNSILGLTVLSWGNSVGDLITNVSVARAGFPSMAIAGCFGGPVFNVLLGLGLPMAFAYVHGESIELTLDVHAQLSLVFLIVTLCSSFLVFCLHKFQCPRWYGWLLLVYYCTYAIINLAIALGVFG